MNFTIKTPTAPGFVDAESSVTIEAGETRPVMGGLALVKTPERLITRVAFPTKDGSDSVVVIVASPFTVGGVFDMTVDDGEHYRLTFNEDPDLYADSGAVLVERWLDIEDAPTDGTLVQVKLGDDTTGPAQFCRKHGVWHMLPAGEAVVPLFWMPLPESN